MLISGVAVVTEFEVALERAFVNKNFFHISHVGWCYVVKKLPLRRFCGIIFQLLTEEKGLLTEVLSYAINCKCAFHFCLMLN